MKRHQHKLQTPNSKLQGSTKPQASRPATAAQRSARYPEVTLGGLWLKEEGNGARHPFDLEESTAVFGENVIRSSKRIPRDPTNNRLIDQLVGAATSIEADYCGASERQSTKDFRSAISRCVKESKESKHLLRMVAASEQGLLQEARVLYREANELHLIFAEIYRKSKP